MHSAVLDRPIDAIVIGASSGGVEAISLLLAALPPTQRTPIFIVLHIPRDHPSGLAELFSSKCALPVREAQDKEPVAAGTVYIAPPDYHLLVDRRLLIDSQLLVDRQLLLDEGPQLALSCDEPVHFSRPAIDCLFETAADVYKEKLLGIILTGGNDDGAAGLAAIQRAGGSTIVQCPETAQMAAMPRAALARCRPDLVIALPEIARVLTQLKTGNL